MISIDPAKPRGIVWLASFPRSGNTWTRLFLMSLRRIVTGGQPDVELDRKLDSPLSRGDAAAEYYQEVLGRPPLQASNQEIATARTQVLKNFVDRTPGIALVKTHSANALIYGVRAIPPELSAGAVYIVRNPLDVALSAADFRGIPLDDAIIELGGSGLSSETNDTQVYTLMGSWSENVMTWTIAEHPTLLVVRYEDMVAQPMETFGSIAAHLAMKFTPEQLAAAIDATSFDKLTAKEERGGFVERPEHVKRFFREGRAGQWKDKLTREQIDRVIADHREQMARFGYLPQ